MLNRFLFQGEESFIGDELVYGGVKGEMKNSIDYRESGYYKSDNEACCRYYFVTICYGTYVEEILQQLSLEPTDIIVMNSCLWDVHRHGKKGIEKYEENLEKLVASLRRLLPDCLFIWLTTPPVHIKSKGGFLMRPGTDMVKINEVKFCNEIAREVFTNANNIDRRFRIVDLDAVFKYFEHHRAGDGVHWNERAHRRMSNMILEEVSKAFNKTVPRVLGKYDSMWDEGNRPHNEYENFNDPHQPLHPPQWGDDYDQDMNWGPQRQDMGPGPGHWQNEPMYHDNSWDYGPMGPRPPLPHPHGFPPFGPPPFGPLPPPLPADLCPDLDDLGQARYLVEYQAEVRKRKHGDEQDSSESAVPEKKYRFGVAPTRKIETKKADQDGEGSPKKVTIVEMDGVMKKLVELDDGVVCHVVMTEKEVAAHKQQQEKERENKEKKEKERLEKEEKDRLEAEKLKNEAEEKEKNAATQDSKKTASILSNLPLVSEVPEPVKADDEKDSKDSKGGAMSKLASKLLSFIKKPVAKLKGSDSKSPTEPVAAAANTTDDSEAVKENNTSESIIATQSLVLDEKAAPVVEASSVSATTKVPSDGDEKPKKKVSPEEKVKFYKGEGQQHVLHTPVHSLVEKLRERPIPPVTSVINNKTVESTSSPHSSERQSDSSATVVKSEPPKPVDHLALLASLSSPFATPKTVKKTSASLKNNNSASSTVSSSSAPSTVKSTEAEEDELLGEEDETMSDIDESILDDGHQPTVQKPKPKPNANINKNENTKKKTVTPVKTQKSTSPKLPTVAKPKNTVDAAKALKKKKKKEKHANETKEERRLRKLKKKEKKEKGKAEKQAGGEVLQSISTISGNVSNAQWNIPFMNDDSSPVAPRQRSATWAPSYYPSYQNQQQPQQHMMQTVVQQPQQAMQQSPLIMNSVPGSYHQNNQVLQQISTMPQQISTTQQRQQQQQQQVAGKSQLYIDEFGQTYTLEEETYVVGPTGQLQAVNHSAMYLQQQQQQQQQQQYATQQASLLYAQQQQQQQARYM